MIKRIYDKGINYYEQLEIIKQLKEVEKVNNSTDDTVELAEFQKTMISKRCDIGTICETLIE